ncbi:hypothetical protein HKX48_004351 [Thoreauomyces humboldtii]|nr:hypothetical protein HKX48_004351 [Thoreauomyces humboldtii]
MVIQPVADGIDQESFKTRAGDLADLCDVLHRDYELPTEMQLYTDRRQAAQATPELTDALIWQFRDASPSRTIYVYYVTAAGNDAAATRAAELFCHVPSFEQNPLWNPTGDLYCIRPVDLIRRLYDELSLALRWFVASHLTATETYYVSGGIKRTRPTRLFFSATDTLRGLKGKPQKQLHVVAISDESYAHAKKQLSKKDTAEEWRWPAIEDGTVHRTLSEYFELRCVWDCDKLLQHIKRNRQYGDEARAAAGRLFQLRNMVFHRSFLAQGSEEEILQYTMRGVLFFFWKTDELFKQCKSAPLHDPKFEKAFSDHLRQLRRMERFSKKMFERLRQPIVNPDEVENLLTKLIASQEKNEDRKANFQLKMQLALTFGTHFSKPLSFAPDVTTADATPAPGDCEPSAAYQAGQARLPLHEGSSQHDSAGALPGVFSVQVESLLARTQVQRWDWDPKTKQPVQRWYPLVDPLGVNHADILWRGLDAMSTVLHDIIFKDIWMRDHRARAYACARSKPLVSIVLSTVPGLELCVFIPEKQHDADLDAEYIDYFRDPSMLLQSLREILEHYGQVTHVPAGFFKNLTKDIEDVLNSRDILSHQYYMEKPAAIDIAGVRRRLNAMMCVIQGALKLINVEHRKDLDQQWHDKVAWRLLATLREAACNDDIKSNSGNYKEYRRRQQVGITERAFELRHSASVRSILDSLLVSKDAAHLRVARSLLDRFFQRETPASNYVPISGVASFEHQNAYAALMDDMMDSFDEDV